MRPSSWLKVIPLVLSTFTIPFSSGRECSSLPPNPKPIVFTLSNCTLQGHGDVPDVESWGLQVTLGSPPQEMCLMTSMFTNNTFVPTVKACSTDQTTDFRTCATRRGGLLDPSSSGSSFGAISSSNDSPPDVNWGAIDPGNSVTEKGTMAFHLPSEISFSGFPIKTIEGGQNHNTGHLGLDRSSPLLQQLSDEKGIVSGFGLDAGSQSHLNPRDGHLIVGGYDKQKVGSSFHDYTVTNSQTSGRICSLLVTITELVLQREGLNDTILISRGEQIPACIEPYDTLFRFPERTLNAFAQATNFVNNSLPDPSQFYIVEPGLTYPASPAFNGTLKFELDHDLVVEIPTEELAHPLRGISPTGERVTMSNTTELNIFREVALLDTAVLGKAFLSRVYLSVQYRSSGAVFRLAKSNPGELPPDPVAFEPDCTNSKKKLSKGAIAGIVIGSLVGAVLIASLAWYLYKRRAPLPHYGPGGAPPPNTHPYNRY